MSGLPELESDLRAVFAVDIEESRYERALERALRVVDDEIAATRMRRRSRSRRAGLPRLTPRALLVMVLVLVLLAAVAVAQPAVRRILFGAPDQPANRVEAFQEPASRSFDLAFLDAQPADDPLDHALQVAITGAADQRTDDPAGWGEPEFDYARLLMDRDVAGRRVQVAAAPTDSGYLCYATTSGTLSSGNCIERLDRSDPARFGSSTDGRIVFVAGIVSDGVAETAVEFADGSTKPAVIGSNAFAWAGPGPEPVAIVVMMVDGTTVRYGPSGQRR